MNRLTATACLIGSMGLIGANVPFGKAVANELPILLFVILRFTIATLILICMARWDTGPKLAELTLRHWAGILFLSLVGSVLFTILILEGTRRTSATEAGIITATLPAVVAALGFLILRQTLKPTQFIAIATAVAGLVVIQVFANDAGSGTLLGNGLVMSAVLCEAAFVLASGPIAQRIHPIRLSLAVSTVSLLVAVPLGINDLVQTDWFAPPLWVWALAIWYALTSSVFCTILWYLGAPHVAAATRGLSTAALPVTALFVSSLFLGEVVDLTQIIGAALVILAIVIGATTEKVGRQGQRRSNQ